MSRFEAYINEKKEGLAKKGEYVVCIDDSPTRTMKSSGAFKSGQLSPDHLTIGKKYKVLDVTYPDGDGVPFYYLKNDNNIKTELKASRFNRV